MMEIWEAKTDRFFVTSIPGIQEILVWAFLFEAFELTIGFIYSHEFIDIVSAHSILMFSVKVDEFGFEISVSGTPKLISLPLEINVISPVVSTKIPLVPLSNLIPLAVFDALR